MFKACTGCGHAWADRDALLSDPAVRLQGYQVNFVDLEAGYFLFTHLVKGCESTFAVRAGAFVDLYDGPVFEERLTGERECPGYCLKKTALEPCPAKCECAFVREVLQVIAHWRKAAA